MVGSTRLSLANRAVVVLVCLVIIGFGLYATGSLKQELYPSLKLPGATVVAVYPGAPSQTVERDVTKPLEDAVRAVGGVTKVSSTSAANLSQVQVEWDYNADLAAMEGKVRTAVDGVGTKLPSGVKPTVNVGSIDDIPVVLLAVASLKDPLRLSDELENVAAPRLRALPGVRDVQVTGQQAQVVTITTRQADLDRFSVDPSQLTQLVAAYKGAIPGGQVVQNGRNVSVQVGRSLGSVDDVKNLQLQGTDGPVALGQLADVTAGPKEATTISRVNGRPALSLSITKTPEANTVTVSHAVADQLPQLSRELGDNTTFTPIFDQAPYVEQSIHDLGTEGGLGLVMAILVILVFLLSVRSTIITAISIPMSLLIAMISLYATGYTLNLLTLSALTVAVGRVVDDSIVVIENIKRHQGLGEEWGTGLIVGAVREVAGAVTASTITTVAVFLPIALVSGQVGELFRPFAVTVTVALLASLVVALTIVPVLAYWFMKPSRKQQQKLAAETGGASLASHETRETPLQKTYLPVLRWTLRHPLITLLVAVLLFAGTMAAATRLKTDFLGESEQTSVQLSQELPVGTALSETDAAARKVEAVLAADPGVQSYQTTVGGGGLQAMFTGAGGQTNKASYSITLKPEAKGTGASERIRGALEHRPELGKVTLSRGDSMGSSSLAVTITGRDEATLTQASEQVAAMMAAQPGNADVKSDLAERQSVLQVNVREGDAAKFGMNQGTVGQAVLQAMQGQTLTQVTIDGRSQDLVLRSGPQLKTKQELEQLRLPVTQKQTADARKRISDELTAQQDAQSKKQQDKGTEQLDEQQKQLDKQRAELQKSLDQLNNQIAQLESASLTPSTAGAGSAGVPGAGGVPGAAAGPGMTPEQLQQAQARAAQAAQAQALAQARAQRDAQLKQLREQSSKLRDQLEAMDESQEKLNQSRTDAAESKATADEMKRKSELAKNIKGEPRLLVEVADVAEVPVTAAIKRVDGERTVTVTATNTSGDLSAATKNLQDGLAGLGLPAGTQATIAGVSTEQQEAFAQLGLAMLIAIAIVYMVMVATFRSLLQPLILLVSVPFAATGAVGLLLLTGTALGIPSMIGLLMLIGIVVTNAIVLIDLVNHYRAEGAGMDDAVIHGARLRLRPIIMTALATIMALVPMAIGITGGGVFISKSLAIVVIGGLVSSTLLTLVLVPVLYHLVEKLRERISHRNRDSDDSDHVGIGEMLEDSH
ncbi:MMPL family transporter [Naumannella sp. ID2617S]|nr:MMPL family transporter [Naumannella sp. ID2617S]